MSSMRRGWLASPSILAAAFALFVGGSAVAQELRMESVTVKPDGSLNTQRILASNPPLQGFSLSISYDPALYEMVDVTWEGGSVDAALQGKEPSFWVGRINAADGTIVVACVLAFQELVEVPEADFFRPSVLATVQYRIRAGALPLGATVPSMFFKDGNPAYPGGPGTENNFTSLGRSVDPVLQPPIQLPVAGGTAVQPPADLLQFDADGLTELSAGGKAAGTLVVLEAKVVDTSPGAQVRLDVEVRPADAEFLRLATRTSGAFVPSGQRVRVEVSGLDYGTAYRWQARTISSIGISSEWTPFSGSPAPSGDFVTGDPATEPGPGGVGGGGGVCAASSAPSAWATGLWLLLVSLAVPSARWGGP